MRFESGDSSGSSFILAEAAPSRMIWDRLGFPDIADHLPLGVVLLNQRFEMQRFNQQYAGYIDAYSPCRPDEAVGRSYFSVVPDSYRRVGDWLRMVREKREKVSQSGLPLPVKTPLLAKTTYWDTSMVPVVDQRGGFRGLIMMTHEVTEREEAAGRETPARLHLARYLTRHLTRRFGLTPREIQVAGMLMEAKTSKEIAEALCVSPACIEFHRNNIRAKLGIKHTRTNLATYLMALGDA